MRSAAASLLFFFLTLGACSDAIHLDPGTSSGGGGGATSSKGAGAGGSEAQGGGAGGGAGGATSSASSMSSTGGQPGTGGGAPSGCVSNAECAYPKNVCDTARGKCVECLVNGDCALEPGTVCSEGSCACPAMGETFCAADASGNPARCVDLQTSATDCGSCGHTCFGACAGGACAGPWEPTSTTGAPAARTLHTAVWTGTAMIVWGGQDGSGQRLSTGGIYDPVARTWTATSASGAPSPRVSHTAVWDPTSMTMIVWGGSTDAGDDDTGAAFDPATNTWQALATASSPQPRSAHTALVYMDTMIVWGGAHGGAALQDGAGYYIPAGTWSPVSTSNAPAPRRDHTAVIVGSTIVVWGGTNEVSGDLGDGGSYDPANDAAGWTTLGTAGSPPGPRQKHTAVVSGNFMVVFGGTQSGSYLDDGGRYNLMSDSWDPLGAGQPAARSGHRSVFVGTGSSGRMVTWGGQNSSTSALDDGASFKISAQPGSWNGALPTGPLGRTGHSAVANVTTSPATQMIVWGGTTASGVTNTGAVFDATSLP